MKVFFIQNLFDVESLLFLRGFEMISKLDETKKNNASREKYDFQTAQLRIYAHEFTTIFYYFAFTTPRWAWDHRRAIAILYYHRVLLLF